MTIPSIIIHIRPKIPNIYRIIPPIVKFVVNRVSIIFGTFSTEFPGFYHTSDSASASMSRIINSMLPWCTNSLQHFANQHFLQLSVNFNCFPLVLIFSIRISEGGCISERDIPLIQKEISFFTWNSINVWLGMILYPGLFRVNS